jgi:hypothetical protein
VKGKFAFSILFFSTTVSLYGQLVCTTPHCDNIQAACKSEKAPANLVLSFDRVLRGQVVDITGAPFDSRYRVQLRDVSVGRILKELSLDSQGRFNFGETVSGNYRLIVVQIENGEAKRFGFNQSAHIVCVGDKECEAKVVLPVGSTDLPENYCSPK